MNLTKGLIFDWTVFEIILYISHHLILVVTYFLARNFEKLMLYVLLFLTRGVLTMGLLHQCPHEQILN